MWCSLHVISLASSATALRDMSSLPRTLAANLFHYQQHGMESTTETIAAVAGPCLELFDDCLSKCTGDDETLAALEHQQRRFRTWASSLNVFSTRISLDAQLRRSGSQEIREMVLLLLDVLSENLSLGRLTLINNV